MLVCKLSKTIVHFLLVIIKHILYLIWCIVMFWVHIRKSYSQLLLLCLFLIIYQSKYSHSPLPKYTPQSYNYKCSCIAPLDFLPHLLHQLTRPRLYPLQLIRKLLSRLFFYSNCHKSVIRKLFTKVKHLAIKVFY